MKYPECEDCYFYGVEPAMCDECVDGDQFEPAEPDDDAIDHLMRLSRPLAKVIPIRPAKKAEPPRREEPELACA